MSRIQAGPWLVDLRRDLIAGPRSHERVPPKAMAVLARLVATPGELVEKEELLRAVWPGGEVGDQVLITAVYRLRRAFAATADTLSPLETVPRRGYVFALDIDAPARRSTATEAAPELGGARASHLRALQLLDGPRCEDLEEGIRLLEATARRWPGFAPAHAGIARAYYMLASRGWAPGAALLAEASAAALRSYELDPNLAAARVWCAMTHLATRWRPAEAVTAIESALSSAPEDPLSRDTLAHCLAASGQVDRACVEAQRALELDPLSPNLNAASGFFLRLAGRLEEAERALRRALELSPEWTIAHLELGRVLLARGDRRRACEAIGQAEPTWSRFLRCLAPAKSASGATESSEARRMLDDWLEGDGGRYVAPYWLAERCVWAGRLESAIDQLERARREQQMHLLFVGVEPTFRPLRRRRRFRQLMAELGSSGTQRALASR